MVLFFMIFQVIEFSDFNNIMFAIIEKSDNVNSHYLSHALLSNFFFLEVHAIHNPDIDEKILFAHSKQIRSFEFT